MATLNFLIEEIKECDARCRLLSKRTALPYLVMILCRTLVDTSPIPK